MASLKINKFFVKTYGCQMNFHDSGLIENGLLKKGFAKAGSIKNADIIILNTCSVRDHADHKIVSELGRFKKNYAGKKIVLAGCFAKQIKLRQENRKELSFDYCFGPDEILSMPSALQNELKREKENSARDDLKDYKVYANYEGYEGYEDGQSFIDFKGKDYENHEYVEYLNGHGGDIYGEKTENGSFAVKIAEGCDNYCSYCIVPYVRGGEKSVPFGEIYETVKKNAQKGANEVLLLGQNVNSYISPDDGKKDFCFLLKKLSEISGLSVIKFLTSHPKDFSDKLISVVCAGDKISKEIHLPVQAGSDKILSAMNRGYTRKDYLRLIEKLRNGNPCISVSTDIIVGFPGETDEDFDGTLSLIDEVKFSSAFAFKYSPRPFTKAYEIKDDIPLEVKKERLEAVFKKLRRINAERELNTV